MTWSSHPYRLQYNNLLCSSDAKAIEDFLAGLGCEIYKEKFVEHDMDLDTLKDMGSTMETAEMHETLKTEIGIDSYGHRHDIIEGVKALPG